jgi:3-deoxy-7-phosphoheptulonate synthase
MANTLAITSSENAEWSPSSWQRRTVSQAPKYEDEEELQAAVDKLSRCSPLVFAGEVRTLHEQLARACSGQGFVLMGGDCAEAFAEFNVNHVRDTFRLILQMSLVLTFGSALPVTKIGRMAGQFAKPRSEPDEVRDGVTLPSYRGDIINSEEFTPESRRHNPWNMVEAYNQSAQTLNILRAFSTGGYADISRLQAWNLDFVEQTEEGSRYASSFWDNYVNVQNGGTSVAYLLWNYFCLQVPQIRNQGRRISSVHEGHWCRHHVSSFHQN